MERTGVEKLLGGLAHIFVLPLFTVLIGFLAPVVHLLLYFAYKTRSRFVVEHTKQAFGLWVSYWLVKLAISLVIFLAEAGGVPGSSLESAYFVLLFGWMGVVGVLSIWGAVRGFLGQEHRYPVIGNLAARIGG